MRSHIEPGNSAQAMSAAVGAAMRAVRQGARPGEAAAVAVWTRIDAWRPWCGAARAIVDERLMARVLALRRPIDQERRLLTYALHQLVVGHWLGLPPLDVRMERDARGCPRIADGDAATSLSHAGTLSAFAVCVPGPVGIDVEPSGPAVDLLELARSIAHPREAVEMEGLGQVERRQRLLALWVRKEASLKAAGVGLACPMEAFEARLDRDVSLPAFGPAARMRLRMLPLADAWTGALAVPAGVEPEFVDLIPPRA